MKKPPIIVRRQALAACGTPNGLHVLSRVVAATLLVVSCGTFVTPWTQNVSGEGRVIAFAPGDRETPIRAPISGRVVRWLVVEGEQVKEGQAIAELADNDPFILERLDRARDAVQSEGMAIAAAIAVAEEQIRALHEARDAALDNAELRVEIARYERAGKQQDLIAARAKEATADINLERQTELNQRELVSDRDLELANLAAATATSELQQAEAAFRASEKKVRTAELDVTETRENNRASIEKARAELEKLRAEVGKVTAKSAEADTNFSRQQQMTLVAPRAGRVLSITARPGGDYVKAGESLATLVPDTTARAVEIWVDGNDAPLITPGRVVRLQFEGWPAVQFVGWPSVAAGTFGGEVAFVDAAARSDGKFRVVIVPDETEQAWPEARYLRQGVRARGWVLLNRVTVAYELWRQLNGFPPALAAPDAEESQKSAGK